MPDLDQVEHGEALADIYNRLFEVWHAIAATGRWRDDHFAHLMRVLEVQLGRTVRLNSPMDKLAAHVHRLRRSTIDELMDLLKAAAYELAPAARGDRGIRAELVIERLVDAVDGRMDRQEAIEAVTAAMRR